MWEGYPPLEQPPWKAYTHTHTHTHTYIYIYIYHCVETRNRLSLEEEMETALVLGLDTEIYGPVFLLEVEDNYYCCLHCRKIECRLGLAVK